MSRIKRGSLYISARYANSQYGDVPDYFFFDKELVARYQERAEAMMRESPDIDSIVFKAQPQDIGLACYKGNELMDLIGFDHDGQYDRMTIEAASKYSGAQLVHLSANLVIEDGWNSSEEVLTLDIKLEPTSQGE